MNACTPGLSTRVTRTDIGARTYTCIPYRHFCQRKSTHDWERTIEWYRMVARQSKALRRIYHRCSGMLLRRHDRALVRRPEFFHGRGKDLSVGEVSTRSAIRSAQPSRDLSFALLEFDVDDYYERTERGRPSRMIARARIQLHGGCAALVGTSWRACIICAHASSFAAYWINRAES